MNYTLFSRCAIAAVLSSSLLGCGENSGTNTTDNTTPTPPEVFPIIAMDGFATVTPGGKASVDVAPYIRGARGFEKLTAVEPIGDLDECSDVTLNEDGLIFEVKTGAGVFCDYQYTVAGQQAGAPVSASMSVFSTSAEQAILPPLSHSMLIDDSSATLNLQALLGSIWPEGYALGTQSVKVQGEASNLGVATSSANVITYTPPSNAGWNRILYTLTDASRPGNDVMGTIYVTVSESANHPPSIDKPKYDYNAENGAVKVKIGQLIDIDLSSAVTEPDGQEWQVIDVRSYTATAAAKDPNSVTNKGIRFQAATVGEHIISYIVADHYGGYSAGLIKVTASESEKANTWFSLKAGGATYSAPLRYSDGVNSGFAVSAVWDGGVSNTLSGYTGISANAYCHSVGALPTLEQMQLLRSAHYQSDKSGELNKWPAMKLYLIKSGTDYLGYDVTTGNTNAYSPQAAYYVTCVINENIQLTILTREVVADGQVKTIARIDKPELVNVTISRVNNADFLAEGDVNLQPQPVGSGERLDITTQSTKAGTYSFRVTNANDDTEAITSPTITYIGDVTNPELTKAGSTDSAVADDAAEVRATFELKDINGNPLANQSVNFAWTASALDGVTVTAPETQALSGGTGSVTGTTDAAGAVLIKAKSVRAISDIRVEVQYLTVNVDWEPDFTSPLTNTNDFIRTGSLLFARPLLSSEALRLTTQPDSSHAEDGITGPTFSWARYHFDKAPQLCAEYNTAAYNGITDWRVPTEQELKTLWTAVRPSVFKTNGWPSYIGYWSSTVRNSAYITVNLQAGTSGEQPVKTDWSYVSCVSGQSLAGPILDIFDAGSGKLFTNSPSLSYVINGGLGGIIAHSGATQEPSGSGKQFYWFTWPLAKELCEGKYNTYSVGGRTNWRLPTKPELTELFGKYGNMNSERGWPVKASYWSSTSYWWSNVNFTGYWLVGLKDGSTFASPDSIQVGYTSCVSNP